MHNPEEHAMRRDYCWKDRWIRKAWSDFPTRCPFGTKPYRKCFWRAHRNRERETLRAILRGKEREFRRIRRDILYRYL